ncbi:MAG: hypothetical protein Q4C96_06095 [Planctomycetia bacterium]|nr:hypothetical protein [Planctomycetia bacterium]
MSVPSKEERYDEAISLKEGGDLTQAIQKLETLCEDFPEYALPHAALSMFYCKEGDFEKSLNHAAKVCQLEPEDPFSFTAMSILARKSGDKTAAEEALSQAQAAQLNYYRALMEKRQAQTQSEMESASEEKKPEQEENEK